MNYAPTFAATAAGLLLEVADASIAQSGRSFAAATDLAPLSDPYSSAPQPTVHGLPATFTATSADAALLQLNAPATLTLGGVSRAIVIKSVNLQADPYLSTVAVAYTSRSTL